MRPASLTKRSKPQLPPWTPTSAPFLIFSWPPVGLAGVRGRGTSTVAGARMDLLMRTPLPAFSSQMTVVPGPKSRRPPLRTVTRP